MNILYLNPRLGVILPPIDGLVVQEYTRSTGLALMRSIPRKRAGINDEYVFKSIQMADAVLTMANDGFATLKFPRNGPIMVDVIYVAVAARGKGVGSRMLAVLMEVAINVGMTGLCVASLEGARDFYVKNGFTTLDQKEDTRLMLMRPIPP